MKTVQDLNRFHQHLCYSLVEKYSFAEIIKMNERITGEEGEEKNGSQLRSEMKNYDSTYVSENFSF